MRLDLTVAPKLEEIEVAPMVYIEPWEEYFGKEAVPLVPAITIAFDWRSRASRLFPFNLNPVIQISGVFDFYQHIG